MSKTKEPTAVPTRTSIGARMRAAREGAGLSQVALGERLGLPQSKISAYERGAWMPRLDLAWRWAQACGCAVDALAG